MPVPGLRRAAATLLALALVACASAEPVPADHYYRLDVAAPAPFQQPKLNGILEVERLVADGVTAGRPVVYSESTESLELKTYHYHFWSEPPTVLLQRALVDALRTAKVAQEVVTPDSRVRPDYVLTGGVKRMEQVVDGGGDKALLELELVLRGERSGNLMLLRSYRVEQPVDGSGMSAFVGAMNAAVSEVFERFRADLATL